MSREAERGNRRYKIATAVWEIILLDGISAVSVRSVADRAGISAGSLRNTFRTKTALMDFALALVEEHATERIQRHFTEADPVLLVRNVIDELLPLDDQRRAEMMVTMSLYAESPNHPEMRQLKSDSHAVMVGLMTQLLQHLNVKGLLAQDVDVDREAPRLLALIDGYAMHMLAADDPDFSATARQHIHHEWRRLLAQPGAQQNMAE
ncbi:TetR/AcrR family transcriptional regulator [Micrococcoides hystricis]|uniref:TetR/AcrR family transcriptional regulator n=1 Tax=Micrococcoides hystricis TaxID=1572761 RepID=A0ABV6PAW3_9MICC